MKKTIINRLIIDRFEGNFAVMELPDRSMVNLPKEFLPEDAVEGDIIEITIDRKETKEWENRVKKLADEWCSHPI